MTDPINTSFYAGGQPQNSLQTLGQLNAIGLQNVQLQQAQQMLAAKQAMGPILQSAVDPQTGDLDYNKAFVGLAANPATAFMAGDFLAQGIQRKQMQAETALKEYDLHNKRMDAVYGMVKGLASLGNSVTQQEATSRLGDLYTSGVLDRQGYMAALGMISRYGSGPQLAGLVRQVMFSTMSSKEAMDAQVGKFEVVDQGNKQVLVQNAPAMGNYRVLQSWDKGLTPEQQAAQQKQINPITQAPEEVTMGQRLQQQGQGGLAEGNVPQSVTNGVVAGPAGKLPSAPSAPMAGGDGSQTPAPPVAQGEGGGGVPPSPAPSHGGLPTTPGAVQSGQSPLQAKMVEKNADYVDKFNTDYEQASAAMRTLDHLADLMQKFKAGPGGTTRREAAEWLQAIGVPADRVAQFVGDNPNALAAQQAFGSLALQYATQQLKKAIEGSRITNMEFQAVVNTKPNENMTPGAIMSVVNHARAGMKIMQGQQAILSRAVQSGNPDEITHVRTDVFPRYLDKAGQVLQQQWSQQGVL